jgi:hypothetical protein
MSGEVLNFDKKKDAGCVAKKCRYVFHAEGFDVCICNPPVPVPIPQLDQFTGDRMITMQPVFPPCVNDTVCGRFMVKDSVIKSGLDP